MKKFLWVFSVFLGSYFLSYSAVAEDFRSSVRVQEVGKQHNSGKVIVFIHGFKGNSVNTWTGSNGFYWPSELKKENALKDYDVLAVNYSTGCFQGEGLIEVTNEIESQLLSRQKSSNYKELIIIAHSMGGLIARQLLLNKNLSPSKKLFFLGSPNMGTCWAEWAKLVCNPNQMKFLEIESPQLDQLNKEWRQKFETRQRSLDFSIHAAYGLGDVFVNKASALAFANTAIPLNKNHRGLAKPSSRDDENYKWVRAEILNQPFVSSISFKEAAIVNEQFQQLYKVDKEKYEELSEQLNTFPTVESWIDSRESQELSNFVLKENGSLPEILSHEKASLLVK